MSSIQYLIGDATVPKAEGVAIICHICNDIGAWGKGFVMAVSARWAEPEKAYRAWFVDREANDFDLGAVQFVQVEPDLWVANMVGQHKIRRSTAGPPIRYEAVRECLRTVAVRAAELGASLHMPRIGAGLAGGDWEQIEAIIEEELVGQGLQVTVYDLKS